MKEDAKVGGSVTGLKDALSDLPELRFSAEHFLYLPAVEEPVLEPDPHDVVYDDDMSSPLPGLAIKPLGVIGGES